MLFNSIEFAFFLPIVFFFYWYVFNKNLKLQNLFIVFVSYLFYGWWDWRFLSLILFSSLVDFSIGLLLGKVEEQKLRKRIIIVSFLINFGFLGFFKYFNFFADSFIDAFFLFGTSFSAWTLKIILPVGISFYTFQSLSYTIDVYKKELKPTNDLIAFLGFVSFFPQLVAGPIMRASSLLPQFYIKRNFDTEKAKDGMRQLLWGLFKKIVIADNLAQNVDFIFSNYYQLNGSVLVLGVFFFAFQIYCDFSGYSDIAIGVSRLFGFELMINFSLPYFSRDIGEFWRRWHISLSTWFRDYLYIPLGGNRHGKLMQIRNSLITFTVSGFWHGANWTFIFWGFLNGLYHLPQIIFTSTRNSEIVAANKKFPSIKEISQILLTFSLVCFAWIFFRSDSIESAFGYISRMVSVNLFEFPDQQRANLFFVVFLVAIEWIQREKQHCLEISKLGVGLRKLIYIVFAMSILVFGADKDMAFIYFQF